MLYLADFINNHGSALRKDYKYIAVFSLWVASLIILVHLFIPHDHHNDNSFIETDGTCTSHENESETRSAFPTHCHAFNVLAFENNKTSVVPTQEFPVSEFISSENTDPVLCYPTGIILQYSDLKELQQNAAFKKLSLLRAPPSLV